ncbi:MAG: hypothetical protein EB116_06605 [Betaproteobacteria bacterium]|nr:hypothetical protein [Betaproteobacteria bacterium]
MVLLVVEVVLLHLVHTLLFGVGLVGLQLPLQLEDQVAGPEFMVLYALYMHLHKIYILVYPE